MVGFSTLAIAFAEPICGMAVRQRGVVHAVTLAGIHFGTRRTTVDAVCGAKVRLIPTVIDIDGEPTGWVMPWPPYARPLTDTGGTRCPDCMAAAGQRRPRSTIRMETPE